MTDEQVNLAVATRAAGRVLHRLNGEPTQGRCLEVCLATALSFRGSPAICVCRGKAGVDGQMKDHWWLRLVHTIIDPCADQFISSAGRVHAQAEKDRSPVQYEEQDCFHFRSRQILPLAGMSD